MFVKNTLYIHYADLEKFMLIEGIKAENEIMILAKLIDSNIEEMEDYIGSIGLYHVDAFERVFKEEQL